MTDSSGLSVTEALRRHYASSSLSTDGGCANEHWALLRVGCIEVRVKNFAWRRRALLRHDLHHLVTGYPCTAEGEFQIATWEFAAGRFPSVVSTLFCLPLVGLGAVTIPMRSFRAYVLGRRSKTLYAIHSTDELLDSFVAELRLRCLPSIQPRATVFDIITYFGLVTMSTSLIALPILVLLVLYLNRG